MSICLGVNILGWPLGDGIDALTRGTSQPGNGAWVATDFAHENSSDVGQVANVWSWPKSRKGQPQMKLVAMVGVFPESSLWGALNNSQGGSQLKLDWRSWRLSKLYWVGVWRTCWWCPRFLLRMTQWLRNFYLAALIETHSTCVKKWEILFFSKRTFHWLSLSNF